MSDQQPSDDTLSPDLLPSPLGELASEQVERLWELFAAIARHWGEPDGDPLPQRSQWLEFVQLRTRQAPSYFEEYRNAIRVLDAWKAEHGDTALAKLLGASGIRPADPATTPLAHMKKYVVDEFIRVWLATGGFRTYGAANYNGYISGSRFATRLPYRHLLAPVEVSSSPPSRAPEGEEFGGSAPENRVAHQGQEGVAP